MNHIPLCLSENERARVAGSVIRAKIPKDQREMRVVNDEFRRDIVQYLPHLRAFALLLAREQALADDLVQDAVLRALSHADQFAPGTNFKAWITTILRNSFVSEIRRRTRAARATLDLVDAHAAASGGQVEHMHARDFRRAMHELPPVQQQALQLVGARGFSYEEAGRMAGCATGTMKSRVSRARLQLQRLLNGGDEDNAAPLPASSGARHRFVRSASDRPAGRVS